MAWPVMLYVPNIIGYFRIACMWSSFYYAQSNYKLALVLYVLNFAGDLVDGFAARLFNQSSNYGATLDMVTDRVSTAGLCAYLAVLYPDDAFAYVSLIVIDVFSHWFHMYASAKTNQHHKDNQANFFLQWYYGCYPLFGYCCLAQEFYYLAKWILRFEPNVALPFAPDVTLDVVCNYVFLPGMLMKQVVNFAQWWNAAAMLAVVDAEAAQKRAK
uniref:CDP-diacylglycerol--inositol 3-phosphatidyltransferase n=1 Tax=Florenciella parvula TaxID=236787 RepID=A0A7S2FPC1_9STRA|mmetsp:Transcript_22323/g.57101  ORF Transcript_22323/g.57101 Transcript_22323/m.57101 type:complete len:214 (+) Transcript_22323:157-798(+)|eukprot:CAMPEP_0182523542 /NCGR_PEP_ID=MMETSP1323-20130603/1134_1 /TAXON_ID=236787 /ORGANISM="Florenciella parvula, Strain RCC1693" /LENGTH=213 /DNA_ID=CAMNT_0024731935 /DNA_START=105 /DNA_END=746 /DNA_ORIENTATION=+